MSQPQTVRVDVPATPEYSHVIGLLLMKLLQSAGDIPDAETVAGKLHVALHEVYMNIVEHAYRGALGRISVSLTLEEAPRRLIIETEDSGAAFDLAQAPEPNLDAGQERGYGLFLVRELMDEVEYLPAPGHNVWRLARRLD